jgi:hypothetical protein
MTADGSGRGRLTSAWEILVERKRCFYNNAVVRNFPKEKAGFANPRQ